MGINLDDHVHVYSFPMVASYVGGDIVAGVLGSGIFQREALTLYMDIGTNGEIVLGNKDWLASVSCSAPPPVCSPHWPNCRRNRPRPSRCTPT